MLKEGAFPDPLPGGIFGQHVHPSLPAGKVGFCPAYSMASADEITLTVNGRGGHAALPHNTIDPIMITGQILTALQQVVSRKSDPITPSVLSFGRINSSGGTYNVIPDSVTVLGTFRTFDENWRKTAHEDIRKIAMDTARGLGGSCAVGITVGYPSLYNDIELTNACMKWAAELLGPENVEEIPPRMTAEDFAYYSLKMPACFYRLGVTPPGSTEIHPVHTSTFDIDEDALVTGPGLMAWIALQRLLS